MMVQLEFILISMVQYIHKQVKIKNQNFQSKSNFTQFLKVIPLNFPYYNK